MQVSPPQTPINIGLIQIAHKYEINFRIELNLIVLSYFTKVVKKFFK